MVSYSGLLVGFNAIFERMLLGTASRTREPRLGDMKDPLHHALAFISLDPRSQMSFAPAFSFRFLEDYLSNANLKERERISPGLCGYLSEMAVINEILTLVRSHRPRARIFTKDEARHILEGSDNWQDCHLNRHATFFDDDKLDIKEVAMKFKQFSKYDYPIVLTKEGLAEFEDRRRLSRKSLRGFWKALRSFFGCRWSKVNYLEGEWVGCTKDEIAETLEPFSLAQSKGYKLELAMEQTFEHFMVQCLTAKIDKEDKEKTPSTEEVADYQMLYTDPAEDKVGKGVPLPPRTKPKTRPAQQSSKSSLLDEDASEEDLQPPAPHCWVHLSEEYINVLQKLYPSPDGAQGTMKWQRFLEAMVDAGFAITQSAGSAVTFRASNGNSIVFHRPHPDPVIDPVLLRIMGRRMNRRFGWTRESFTEMEKAVDRQTA